MPGTPQLKLGTRPGAISRMLPSGTSQRIVADCRSTATSLPHGGFTQGKSRSSTANNQGRAEIEKAAYKIVDVAMNMDLPDFVAERLLQLKILLEMTNDGEWQLGDDDRERIMSAMSYFADPIDLIPDHIPGIGFLDDAIFAEIVFKELKAEINAYNEFCDFRNAEEARLSAAGKDPDEDCEFWLSAKRNALHAQINEQKDDALDDGFVFHLL